MAKNAFSVSVRGVKDALQQSGSIRNQLLSELEGETDKAAMRVVNDGRKGAPRLTGQLANSIDVYFKDSLSRTVSSDKAYFAKQEYMHPTNKGFMRRAISNEESRFQRAIKSILRKVGG